MTLEQKYYVSPLNLKLEQERDRLMEATREEPGWYGVDQAAYEEYAMRVYLTKFVNQGLKASWYDRHELVKKTLALVESGGIRIEPRSAPRDSSGDLGYSATIRKDFDIYE